MFEHLKMQLDACTRVTRVHLKIQEQLLHQPWKMFLVIHNVIHIYNLRIHNIQYIYTYIYTYSSSWLYLVINQNWGTTGFAQLVTVGGSISEINSGLVQHRWEWRRRATNGVFHSGASPLSVEVEKTLTTMMIKYEDSTWQPELNLAFFSFFQVWGRWLALNMVLK